MKEKQEKIDVLRSGASRESIHRARPGRDGVIASKKNGESPEIALISTGQMFAGL